MPDPITQRHLKASTSARDPIFPLALPPGSVARGLTTHHPRGSWSQSPARRSYTCASVALCPLSLPISQLSPSPHARPRPPRPRPTTTSSPPTTLSCPTSGPLLKLNPQAPRSADHCSPPELKSPSGELAQTPALGFRGRTPSMGSGPETDSPTRCPGSGTRTGCLSRSGCRSMCRSSRTCWTCHCCTCGGSLHRPGARQAAHRATTRPVGHPHCLLQPVHQPPSQLAPSLAPTVPAQMRARVETPAREACLVWPRGGSCELPTRGARTGPPEVCACPPLRPRTGGGGLRLDSRALAPAGTAHAGEGWRAACPSPGPLPSRVHGRQGLGPALGLPLATRERHGTG